VTADPAAFGSSGLGSSELGSGGGLGSGSGSGSGGGLGSGSGGGPGVEGTAQQSEGPLRIHQTSFNPEGAIAPGDTGQGEAAQPSATVLPAKSGGGLGNAIALGAVVAGAGAITATAMTGNRGEEGDDTPDLTALA
jgi:hypothetical protein